MSLCSLGFCSVILFFFFNDTATTEIYTLSLHDALPISGEVIRRARRRDDGRCLRRRRRAVRRPSPEARGSRDRKSTRLNSSHTVISYAVFCLKKKKKSNQKKRGSTTTESVKQGCDVHPK